MKGENVITEKVKLEKVGAFCKINLLHQYAAKLKFVLVNQCFWDVIKITEMKFKEVTVNGIS